MERARPAGMEDTDRLVQLCNDAFEELTPRRGGPQLVRTVMAGRSVAAGVTAMLADPAVFVVIGELSGVTMGIGTVRVETPLPLPVPGETHATVELLYVEPGARGVGLGEAIMDAMASWAVARGCTGIDAVALPGVREAKAFFETHGMTARALIMHRPLGTASPSPTPGGDRDGAPGGSDR